MKNKRIFAISLIFSLVLANQAKAQMDPDLLLMPEPEAAATPLSGVESVRPAATANDTIGMVYFKLAGKVPEFDKWAMETDAYKNATDFERPEILEREMAAFRSVYDLTTLGQPVTVELKATVSPYNFKNKGFFISGFDDETFFPFTYAGRNFALVVPSFSENQWQSEDRDDVAMKLDQGVDQKTRAVDIVFMIEPTYADENSKVTIEGKEYQLISGKLQTLQLYVPGTNNLLWQTRVKQEGTEEEQASKKELLNLYQ